MAVTKLREDIGAYLSDREKELVQRAYSFAAAHSGQFRISGEEFVEHPVAVARILSELEGDAQTLAAALLRCSRRYLGHDPGNGAEFGNELPGW